MNRKHPVVIGTNAKGELVWGFIPMPYWQMAMFPIRYMGDFLSFWYRKSLEEKTGIESKGASMDISKVEQYGKTSYRRPSWGD